MTRVARIAVPTFRVVVVLHALMLLAQPILAGSVLDGQDAALAAHGGVGGTLVLVSMAQTVLAVLVWRPARGPAWPIWASAAMVALETTQLTIGYSGTLALHVPLGVALVLAGVLMAWWTCRHRPGCPASRISSREAGRPVPAGPARPAAPAR